MNNKNREIIDNCILNLNNSIEHLTNENFKNSDEKLEFLLNLEEWKEDIKEVQNSEKADYLCLPDYLMKSKIGDTLEFNISCFECAVEILEEIDFGSVRKFNKEETIERIGLALNSLRTFLIFLVK